MGKYLMLKDAELTNTFSKVNVYTSHTFATISVSSNNDNYGGAYGSGTYPKGMSVNVVATPLVGHTFKEWSDGNKQQSRQIIANSNLSLIAYFE